MKAVMISIQPKWVEKIANGQKTIEVRKTRPKLDMPFKCYIYCTKGSKGEKMCFGQYTCHIGNGKVIGHFVCDRIYNLVQAGAGIMFATENLDLLEPQMFRDMSCLTDSQLADYLGNKDGYAWHITDLVIYDEPKALGEFEHSCPTNLKKIPYINCLYCRYNFVGNRGNKCDCKVTRPPQSWCYVEEKEQNNEQRRND